MRSGFVALREKVKECACIQHLLMSRFHSYMCSFLSSLFYLCVLCARVGGVGARARFRGLCIFAGYFSMLFDG